MHVILGDIAAGKARAWQGIEAWMMAHGTLDGIRLCAGGVGSRAPEMYNPVCDSWPHPARARAATSPQSAFIDNPQVPRICLSS
jgi:hypothetical protein